MNSSHGGRDVEECCERVRLVFHEEFVAIPCRGIVRRAVCEEIPYHWMRLRERIPHRVAEVVSAIFRQEHQIDSLRNGGGDLHRPEARLRIAIGPCDYGIEVAEVVVERDSKLEREARVEVSGQLFLIPIDDADESLGVAPHRLACAVEQGYGDVCRS